MSCYTDTRDAISKALQAVDSDMRVVDYLASPNDTSPEGLLKVFQNLKKSNTFNCAIFTRKVPGVAAEVAATGSGFEVRWRESQWWIKLYQSSQDPVNAQEPDEVTPSEYAFQSKVDGIVEELYLNENIQALMTSQHKATVVSVSGNEVWFEGFSGEHRCHSAEITITIRHI